MENRNSSEVSQNPFAALFPSAEKAEEYKQLHGDAVTTAQIIKNQQADSVMQTQQITVSLKEVPDIESANESERVVMETLIDEKDRVWMVNDLLQRVFLITVDNDSDRVGKRQFGGLPKRCVYLRNTALDGEVPILQWINIDEAIMERLSMPHPRSHVKVTGGARMTSLTAEIEAGEVAIIKYLASCYRRAFEECTKWKEKDSNLLEMADRAKTLALSYAGTCLLSPEMFSKADPHKQLFQLLLTIQGDQVLAEFMDGLVQEHQRKEDLNIMFSTVLSMLAERAKDISSLLQSDIQTYINVLYFFAKHTGLAEILVSSKFWFPSKSPMGSTPGHAFERQTLLGYFVGLTSMSPYRVTRDSYSAILKENKTTYYADMIDQCAGNSKKLFRVVNSLTNEQQDRVLPPHDDPSLLANEFGEFFCRKIELIKEKIDQIDVVPPVAEFRLPQVKLESFSPLSEDEARNIIMASNNASCQLDPIPTWLLKSCCDMLVPIITQMINLSFEKGTVPDSWKSALVLPLLKKPGLDPVYKNFRPVSNLPFVAKLVEKAAISRLLTHCTANAPLPDNQSSYRQFHSTETALLKVQNDILTNMDNQEVTLLVMLDLSAAFDTIDHTVLVDILENNFGVIGNAQKWIKSFLSERKQQVIIDQSKSAAFDLKTGVPQGSCLGPILFLFYASGLFNIISKHLPFSHGYADDTQLYLSFKPDPTDPAVQDTAVKAIEDCIHDVRAWMVHQRLLINDSKTEFIVIGSRQQLTKLSIDKLKVGEVNVSPVNAVRNLGAWFDVHMSMNTHVGKVCSKAFRSLYHIRQIRKYLSEDSAKILVHAFVTSHIDYCNSLLYGIPKYQFDRLQKVLNAAARVVCLVPKFDHITPTLMKLHWLPVKERVMFKILLITYKALHGQTPQYICELLSRKVSGRHSLRSAKQDLLVVPRTHRKTFGDRAFAKAGPTLWNSLPQHIRCSSSVDCFKNRLKTYLFKNAYIT